MANTTAPTMPPAGVPQVPQGAIPAIGIPNSQDIPRLVFSAPYFEQVPLAELIEPAVIEATEAALPGLVPPYVDAAANAAVQNLAVLLTGSTMTGPLFLNPVMPTQPSQAASMAYVDALLATAGIPDVPVTPIGQTWGRQTGQWVPISEEEGVFLPLAGGIMGGQINMSGNSIINLAPVPQMPYGAAPAQWVLDQISNAALYQGIWNADTNTPNLTLPGYWQNGFSWITTTQNPDGVVITETIPGLTGNTVMNGDTIVYSTVQAQFAIVSAGALTLAQANALFLALNGGQMTGALLLNTAATQAMQATPLSQVQSLISAGAFPEPPGDGQTYGRNGLQQAWLPVVNVAGGIMTGPLQLSGNATLSSQATPLAQVQSLVTAGTAAYLPLTGGSLTGPLSVGAAQGGTVVAQLTVGGQGINYAALGAPGSNIAFAFSSGSPYMYVAGTAYGPLLTLSVGNTTYLQLSGGTITGNLGVNGTTSLGLMNVSGAANFTSNILVNPTAASLPSFGSTPVPGVWSAIQWGTNAPPAFLGDYYGNYGYTAFRMTPGTPTAPTAILSNVGLGDITWSAWNGTNYQTAVYIRPYSAENWTASAAGTSLSFGVVPAGSLPSAMVWPLNIQYWGLNVTGNVGFEQASGFYMGVLTGLNGINFAPNAYFGYTDSNQYYSWANPGIGTAMILNNQGTLSTSGGYTTGPVSISTPSNPGSIQINPAPSTYALYVVGTNSPGITVNNVGDMAFTLQASSGQAWLIEAPGTGQVPMASWAGQTMQCGSILPFNDNVFSLGVGDPNRGYFQVASYWFNNISDPRRKRDLKAAPAGALAKVKAIGVKTFRHKDDDETKPLRTGFDATEIHAAHPDAAQVGKDGSAVSYSVTDMLALLWQAVQELTAKVEAKAA